MRLLGHLFLFLVISSLIILVNRSTNSNFLNHFFNNQLIPTLASLVGFSIVAVIFLIGQLDILETKNGKPGIFSKTREEIKHNIYFVLIIFTTIFLLLIFKIDSNSLIDNISKIKLFVFEILILAGFLSIIFSIFEIMRATFKLNKKK